MLRWALIFFVVAIVAAVFGFVLGYVPAQLLKPVIARARSSICGDDMNEAKSARRGTAAMSSPFSRIAS